MRHSALALLALTWALPAHGQSSDLTDDQVERRISRIESAFQQEQSAERRWHWGWTAGLGGLALGQGTAIFLVDNKPRRASLIYGTTTSGLGSLIMLIRGNPALDAHAELEALPAGTPAERRAKLKRAEQLLDDSAERAELDTNPWLAVGAPVVGALAMGSYLWFKLDAPLVAGSMVGFSTLISSVRFFTRPRGLLRFQEQAAPVSEQGVSWTVVPSVGGAAVVGSF